MTGYRLQTRWVAKSGLMACAIVAMTATVPAFAQLPAIKSEPLPPVPGVALPQAATPALNAPAIPPVAAQGPAGSTSAAPAVVPMPRPIPGASTAGAPVGQATPPAAGQTEQGGAGGAAPEAQQTQPSMTWPNDWEPRKVARIQALDKVNAQVRVLTIPVGQSATFGSLTILAKACVVRPKNEPPDAAAFLVVTDSHPSTQGFTGWMLEDEPSVSMMEHPLYDLRVVGCG